jgi:hypothetical protein
MAKTKLLTVTILTVLIIISSSTLSAFATTVPTFNVSPLSTSQLPIFLPTGTIFNGSISTTGTVRFWVNSPTGAQIVNRGLVDNTTEFDFVAEQDGNYTMNFENGLPTSDPVQITFSYVTNPDISGGNNSTETPLLYLLIFITITVVGSVLIIILVHRKNKKRVLKVTSKNHSSLLTLPKIGA